MSRRELVQVSLASSVKATFADLVHGSVGDLVQALLLEDGQDVVQELGLASDATSDAATAGIEAATRAGRPDALKYWALQRVVISQPNRRWSDQELVEAAIQGGESCLPGLSRFPIAS
jgi:hypothetical protein